MRISALSSNKLATGALLMSIRTIPVGYAQPLEFHEFQAIPTHGAFDWESFTIGTNHYLAVANYNNGSAFNI
jgi:hypothetical protein